MMPDDLFANGGRGSTRRAKLSALSSSSATFVPRPRGTPGT